MPLIDFDLIAPVYNKAMYVAEKCCLREWRRKLISRVKGKRVLEVGIGTGANIPFYPPHIELYGLDSSRKMLGQMPDEYVQRLAGVFISSADKIPVENSFFDTALSTFVFCNLEAPEEVAKEMVRVVRPGGQLLFLEHTSPCNTMLKASFKALEKVTVPLMHEYFTRDVRKFLEKLPVKKVHEERSNSGILLLVEYEVVKSI
ncbi:MAG: methyltransferase domain-containing protein [Chlorobi bacterium]|nr:methyltransferase domain-containing protein [Chlorobiota bacterium]